MDHPFPYDFSGRTAVVTGAARGFGLEFAKTLCGLGAFVVLGDVDVETGEREAAALRDAGQKASFLRLDVRDPADAAAAAEHAVAEGGSLDIWINNAGIARHGPSERMSRDDWQLPLDIMLSGTFFGAQAAGRAMLAQGSGSIVNIASVNGLAAQAGRASYVAAKAGTVRLTQVLAAEWAPRGIRVNAIAPAVMMTDLVRTSLADGSANLSSYVRRSPTGRLGEVSELVSTLLFLVSSYSSYITGQTLKVDGGWVADHYL